MNDLDIFIKEIPKAELHVHIEGTFEPELIFQIAKRNKIEIKHNSIDKLKEAYNFLDLQSFLDVYYEGTQVLLHEQDFYDLTWAYLEKANEQNVLHTEIFFDPQAHEAQGASFEAIVNGINKALINGKEQYGISSSLIMCFLRHLSEDEAMKTLEESIPFKDKIIGIGLDSSEVGNPPSKFEKVFAKAKSLGYLLVAHAGEEGPPEYIWEAINKLKVLRIDHGVRCTEDKTLVAELVEKQIPLTVCPFSNVKLQVFKELKDHNIKEMLDLGLNVSIHSDDPAYFGGYVNENYLAIQKVFHLTKKDIYKLAKNSFESSFLSREEKDKYIKVLDVYAAFGRL